MKNVPSNQRSSSFSMWQFAWQLGYMLAVPLVGGVVIGHLLDKRFNSAPWLLIAGLLLGITLSTIAVVKQTGQAMKKISEITSDKSKENSQKPS